MVGLEPIYELLSKRFGKQSWWPAETPLEVIVGAILTQQTSWKNVEVAIKRLKDAQLLSIAALSRAPLEKVEECTKPTGFYKQKAARLKSFCAHIEREHGGDLGSFLERDLETVRRELMSMDGIGPETADSILLYASNKPTFVVDGYTRRILKRLGLEVGSGYEEIKSFFESNMPRELHVYREFHALLVELGKNYCRPRPLCDSCPLVALCDYAQKESPRQQMPGN